MTSLDRRPGQIEPPIDTTTTQSGRLWTSSVEPWTWELVGGQQQGAPVGALRFSKDEHPCWGTPRAYSIQPPADRVIRTTSGEQMLRYPGLAGAAAAAEFFVHVLRPS